MNSESQHPQNRRAFFRDGLSRVMGPIGDFLEKRFDLSGPGALLRPPGALPEGAFLEACHRCGACVDACPADAIFPWQGGDAGMLDTPVIDPNRAPCVVCDELACMNVCPSGALRLVASAGSIRMGLARVSRADCVRTAGEDCTICVDHCPIGQGALRIVGPGLPQVLDDGCVGCGVCQHDCPTGRKAIVVDAFR